MSQQLSSIRRVAARAELRMRMGRVLAALPTAATLALVVAGIAVAVRKMWPGHLPERLAWAAIIGAGASVIMAVAYAGLRKLAPHSGALALDAEHGLSGRLTNAIEFEAVPEAERTAFMRAAIDDACATARALSARRAVHIPFPPELAVTVLAAGLVGGIALLEVRIAQELPRPPKQSSIKPLEIPEDDLEDFKAALAALEDKDQSPQMQKAIEEFNQLLREIAERRINREDAFKRMQQIEDTLNDGADADKKALEEQLKQTAQELDKSILAKPVGEALKRKDYKEAQKELKKLADKLRDKKKPDKAELERLRKALERASKRKQEALQALKEQRASLKEEILSKKEELKNKQFSDPKEKEKEEEMLRKKERELERLDRNIKEQEAAQKKLDKLDRSLSKAAQDLLKDLGLSAEEIEQLAEELNRL